MKSCQNDDSLLGAGPFVSRIICDFILVVHLPQDLVLLLLQQLLLYHCLGKKTCSRSAV